MARNTQKTSPKKAAKKSPAKQSAKKPAAKKPAAKKPAAKKPAAKKPAARKPAARKPAAKKPAAKKPAAKKPAAKKPAPKKAAAKKPAPKKAAKPLVRQDRPGHLSPRYARELIEKGGGHEHDDDTGFLRRARSSDDLAERLGEDFVASATSGEAEAEHSIDQIVPEESGGPFQITRAVDELADDIDESNPEGSTREPFPTV